MKFIQLTIIVSLFVISSCRQHVDKALQNKIQEIIISGQKELDLKRICDFEWDSLIIMPPYINTNLLEEKINIDLSKIKYTNIEQRDDICLLLFFDKCKIVRMVEYPRYPGDFADNIIEFIPKDKAIFSIIITDRKTVKGDNWIELKRK